MLDSYHTELLDATEIGSAVDYLKTGHVVSFPTETVYGLGAPIFSEAVIKKIFDVKGRPSDNPLIAHISNIEQVHDIAIDIPEDFYLLAEAFFPGPLTVILPKHPNVPLLASAGLPTIGVRMPEHPVALELIKQLGEPIVAPSANISGRPSSTSYQHVLDDFQGRIAAVLISPPSSIGLESTVVSIIGEEPVVLRPGKITAEEISLVLKKKVRLASYDEVHQGPILSPGMKYRHYAPKASVRLFFSLSELERYLQKEPALYRLLLCNEKVAESSSLEIAPLSSNGLYAALRHADDLAVAEVLALCDRSIQKQHDLMNRLLKASQG